MFTLFFRSLVRFLGTIIFAQQTVDSKSNEIPAAQALLEELDIRVCLVTADAMNCQTETAKIILEGKGDYLLCAKGNHDQTMEAVERNIKSLSHN